LRLIDTVGKLSLYRPRPVHVHGIARAANQLRLREAI